MGLDPEERSQRWKGPSSKAGWFSGISYRRHLEDVICAYLSRMNVLRLKGRAIGSRYALRL